MRNPLDSIVEFIAPGWAMKRVQARNILAYYEGARKDKQRKQRREPRDGETALSGSAVSLREQARHFEQNSDLARGVLRVLVNHTVGPRGITFEPMPMTRGGAYHEAFALDIQRVLRRWSKRPEVTWQMTWSMALRLAARTYFRDGECFAQTVTGTGPAIQHGSAVPFSLKFFEPDLVPFDNNTWDGRRRKNGEKNPIINGCEINGWGRPVAWWIYDTHPGQAVSISAAQKVRRVQSDRIIQLAAPERLHQRRGVSFFASILKRLDDLKDYEESERIAAKVAASMGAFITRGTPDMYDPDKAGDEPRDWRMRPGLFFEGEIGESVEMVGNNGRPNPALESFRSGQLRALASGPGVTYSSLSKNYNGTYSSQRQELVEGYVDYAVISDDITARLVEPSIAAVIEMAILSGELVIPADVDTETVSDGLFISPQMPWIDPDKEAKANERLERAGQASGPEIIRKRGRNPLDVFESERRWRERWKNAGLSITADPSSDIEPAPEATTDSDENDEQENALEDAA